MEKNYLTQKYHSEIMLVLKRTEKKTKKTVKKRNKFSSI